MDKNKKKGFTLVELIVVLAILAILAAMLVPALTGYIDKANEKKVIATARQYYVAAQTVASEAYANNDKLQGIILLSGSYTVRIEEQQEKTYSKEQIANSTSEQVEMKYLRDFVSLAEENEKVTYFLFETEKGKVVIFMFLMNNKYVVLKNGALVVDN